MRFMKTMLGEKDDAFSALNDRTRVNYVTKIYENS